MATMTDLAKDAFSVMICDSFECELLGRYLLEVQESTAVAGGSSGQQQRSALSMLGTGIRDWSGGRPNRLKQLTELLIATVISKRLDDGSTTLSANNMCSDSSVVDPLCCPICEDILRFPVTATCGHTFCRQCCFGHSQCAVCSQKFPTISSSAGGSSPQATVTSGSVATAMVTVLPPLAAASSASTATSSSGSASASSVAMATVVTNHDRRRDDERGRSGSVIGFEQDILVRRLVERWWGPELKAAELNEEAQRHLEGDALDEALRCCNQSLEYGE